MVDTDTSRQSKTNLFSIDIDQETMESALKRTLAVLEESRGDRARYIVTPNVDHIVVLRKNKAFQDAYKHAWMVLADGWPLVLASRLLRRPLPERVAGSDFVPSLLKHLSNSETPRTCFLLGGMPGVPELAAKRIRKRWPGVEVVGTFSPPLGFESDAQQNALIHQEIRRAKPDIVIVGLGAPKQEIWLHQHHQSLHCKVAIAAGATIDFLAGQQTRAPVWAQKLGCEWLHRVASDPRRLAGRYARDAACFPIMLASELAKSSLIR